MSEANMPPKNQGIPPESTDPNQPDWVNLLGNAMGPADTSSHPQAPELKDWQDWQTVDFPNAISVDAMERQAFYANDVTEPDWINPVTANPAPPLETGQASEQTEQPEDLDLLALVQELNQCNDDLINRVAQLEAALDSCQSALQVEITRSQEQETLLVQSTQDLSTAQEQVTYLFNELEFANQAAQRQQILIETLTGQLENSQERVAQLERECALTQQRHNEQSHMLLQTENTCRDLQTRLQRQQRYTLQFKAALEKCLEVPPPHYESSHDTSSNSTATPPPPNLNPTSSLLPKVNRIQPWSSQPGFPGGHLNLERYFDAQTDSQLPTVEASKNHQRMGDNSSLPSPIAPSPATPPSVADASDASDPNLQVQNLPFLADFLDKEPNLAAPQPRSSISYDLRRKLDRIASANANRQQAEAQAIAANSPDPDSTINLKDLNLKDLSIQSKKDQIDLPVGAIEQKQEAQGQRPEPQVQPQVQAFPETFAEHETPMVPEGETGFPNLGDLETGFPNLSDLQMDSMLEEAEDILWQDLARLIDASEVVDANSSENFVEDFVESSASAEPINTSTPLQGTVEAVDNSKQPSTLEEQVLQRLIAEQQIPEQSALAEEEPPTDPQISAFTPNASWPSPVVYPLRPHRKRTSLAAVELPSFPNTNPPA